MSEYLLSVVIIYDKRWARPSAPA